MKKEVKTVVCPYCNRAIDDPQIFIWHKEDEEEEVKPYRDNSLKDIAIGLFLGIIATLIDVIILGLH